MKITFDEITNAAQCGKPCKRNMDKETCEYCARTYEVSSGLCAGTRPANGKTVIGLVIKNKATKRVEGILNAETQFCELAWVKEDSIRPATEKELAVITE